MGIEQANNDKTNPFLKKELDLNIAFQQPYVRPLSKISLFNIPAPDVQQDGPAPDTPVEDKPLKGLEVEKESGIQVPDIFQELIRREDGTIAEIIVYDGQHSQIRKVWIDEIGIQKAYMDYGKETDTLTEFQENQIFIKTMNKQEELLRTERYEHGRLLEANTFEQGNLSVMEFFDLSTGEQTARHTYIYNEKNQCIQTNSEYSGTLVTHKYEYNENGQKIKDDYQNESTHTADILDPETQTPVQRIYYDADGNIYRTAELINDEEIEPVATEIFNGAADEIKSKIHESNVLHILRTYNIKSPDKNIIETILGNENIKDKKGVISHIAQMAKEQIARIANNNDTYNNKEIITESTNKMFAHIDKQLENLSLKNAKAIAKTFDTIERMCMNSDFFIDKANGKVDKITYQGGTDDCWMLAGINSLAGTSHGQELLSKCLEVDEATGDITVKLKGGEKIYTFTQEELQGAGHLSKGDYDVRAIELAVEKYFKEEKPYGEDNINGNHTYVFWEILTGEKAIRLNHGFNGEALPVNCPIVAEIAPDEILPVLEKLQPNVAMVCSARTGANSSHAYTINRIEGTNVYISEPHNASNEVMFTLEEFKENFFNIEFMVLSEQP
ncbi:MAG: hypothetical protein LBK53_02830 [Heliobacteriaceae bacterium]|jgi:hypothetical protein|nr:hypothetical protein [Heliobacteriaceae bacterium]